LEGEGAHGSSVTDGVGRRKGRWALSSSEEMGEA
jgi:hypothetical protein